jgi:hypothetical protein
MEEEAVDMTSHLLSIPERVIHKYIFNRFNNSISVLRDDEYRTTLLPKVRQQKRRREGPRCIHSP